ncbi:type VI secretion system amidase effector protein Tae4 [Massilia terrae]|uniref:Type VI secretion system amidase effector protein Tae4 n=1 Tax=Massilia terrae TaxID=1811224 RepID=A0ABT2CR90_9BURK|nr:type VI secretion system amidase effector protein Tae4 [Massilia terrae]MCS0656482.1 type VI secretion system amidase effector protein Tae4 [Massilia terrae]
MKVPYNLLRMHFPDIQSVTRDELFQWIAYPENVKNPNFENTCAIRLSLASLGAGYPNPGNWPIKAGKYKGRAVETKQRALSQRLVHFLGQPEKFLSGSQAETAVGSRHGIVSFFSIYGDANRQGHIAIVAQDRWGMYLRCGNEIDGTDTGCYWHSSEVWFWPLR